MIINFLKRKDEGYPHVSNFALLAFFAYVNIWYLQVGIRVPALGAIRIEFLWSIFLILLIALKKEKVNLTDNPMAGITIMLLLVMAIQVPLSVVPAHSWDVFFNRVIKFAFMAFFIVQFVRSPKGLIVFICAFMLACMKMGQEGVMGVITGGLVWENQGVMRLHGSTPLYGHPNSYAGMALGMIPFIIYLYPIVPKIFKVALVIQFVFACNIILHTGSRTGYVAFILMLLFVVMTSRKKLAAIMLIGLLSVVSISFIDDQYIARFNTMITGEEIEGASMGARKQILDDAVQVFLNNPLGVGVSAFPAVRSSVFGRSQDTHNLYLEVATNLGIQGLIIFLLFVYKMMSTLSHIAKKSSKIRHKLQCNLKDNYGNKDDTKTIQDLLLIENLSKAVTLFLIVRLSLGLFGMDMYEIYWWFSLGLTISLYNLYRNIEKKSFF